MVTRSYIDIIDAKITHLELELLALKRAREIIRELMDKRHEEKVVAAVKKEPRTKKTKALREQVIEYFSGRVAAVKSRDIIEALKAKDSQVWKILADLRKEGFITYDLQERTYLLATLNGGVNDAAA
jgi:hypothetical protein